MGDVDDELKAAAAFSYLRHQGIRELSGHVSARLSGEAQIDLVDVALIMDIIT